MCADRVPEQRGGVSDDDAADDQERSDRSETDAAVPGDRAAVHAGDGERRQRQHNKQTTHNKYSIITNAKHFIFNRMFFFSGSWDFSPGTFVLDLEANFSSSVVFVQKASLEATLAEIKNRYSMKLNGYQLHVRTVQCCLFRRKEVGGAKVSPVCVWSTGYESGGAAGAAEG